MTRRVVITGMGAVTPLGHSPDALYRGQIEGKSGIDWITRFDASGFPTRFAGEVRGFELGKYVKDPDRFRDAGNNTRFALAAARQALEHAGLLNDTRTARDRFGFYMGLGEGTQDFHLLTRLVRGSYLP